MTIKFNCPKCNSLIAFVDKHAGKAAHCQNCGQQFIIPAQSDEKPRIIEPKVEPEFPVPGFYHAVFLDSWKIFFDKDNMTALAFVTAAVCFKFFSTGACCLTFVVYFAAWGCLLGFYLKVIYETAVGGDKLPEIEVGTSITFLWYIIKPIFIFVFVFIVVQLPLFISLAFFKDQGVTWENIWHTSTGLNLLLRFLFIVGLFLFPTAILAAAVLDDVIELFRFDRLVMPVVRAFFPYLVVVGILVAACFIETNTRQNGPHGTESAMRAAGKLALNLAGQVVAIIAMRSIGLFYRHFGCYFRY